jgi:hypothetical protein
LDRKGHDLFGELAGDFADGAAGELGGGFVKQDDAAGVVEGEDAVGHGVEDAAQFVALGFDDGLLTGGLGQGLLEANGYPVEGNANFRELPCPAGFEFGTVIAAGEVEYGVVDAADRAGQELGKDEAEDNGGQDTQDHDGQDVGLEV